jgi:hypothetical protein
LLFSVPCRLRSLSFCADHRGVMETELQRQQDAGGFNGDQKREAVRLAEPLLPRCLALRPQLRVLDLDLLAVRPKQPLIAFRLGEPQDWK